MKAKEYFDAEYDETHISTVVGLNDMESLYGLMEEYAEYENKDLQLLKDFLDQALAPPWKNAFEDFKQQQLIK